MILYDIIISPIKQILEIFYILFSDFLHSSGISIIGLSFVVTFFCLPLYIVAESWQEKERLIKADMAAGVKRIKETFKGDEQYMILSTFYREHHYHPMMALRSSLGLLIQIPFFMAAYSYLSNLSSLQGQSFFFISDLGNPDSTFHIGFFAVNLLPIAMTVINGISGAIYSKGHDISEKIQIYVCALIFLVLLYNSPSGLVLYWTMNNILSLVKNVFYKIKNPLRTLYIIFAGFAILGLAVCIFFMSGKKAELRLILAVFSIFILISPFVLKALNRCSDFLDKGIAAQSNRTILFILSASALAILTGLTVPSMLIESETNVFCYVDNYTSPFIFLKTSFAKSVGFYLFWPACFYFLFSNKVKNILTLLSVFLAFFGLLNTFAFSGNYGPLNQILIFMEPQTFSSKMPVIIINSLLAILIAAATLFFILKKRSILSSCFCIILIGLSGTSLKNIASISSQFSKMAKPDYSKEPEPVFHLSKTGKNVLVFMQDRGFLPYTQPIFEEDESLAKHFDGFIFYKNTVSMAQYTMLGTPGIFGGYSYTPYEINRDKEKSLRQKHNESILSLPLLFSENGYSATLADMPYENYLKQPSSEMYEDYPQIQRVYTHGAYSNYWFNKNGVKKGSYVSTSLKHNLNMFGIFKTFPPYLRRLVYHSEWWDSSWTNDRQLSWFINNYSEMDLLPELTDFTSEKDTYFTIDNEATHETIFLKEPDYVPANPPLPTPTKNRQYHVQAGIFRCYARFFDYLKENGVYDNTRIIIVSDHGADIETGDFDNSTGIPPFKKESVLALLLFKDFNSHGTDGIRLLEDDTFMTNADTAYLATKDLITDAKNPFTGFPLELGGGQKEKYVKICHPQAESTRIRERSYFSIPDDGWYTVTDSIYENENWKSLKVEAE